MKEQKLEQIFQKLEFDRSENDAKVYGITEVGGEMLVNLITKNTDIYDAIDDVKNNMIDDLKGIDSLNFITWGWAAPLNENGEIDGAPSQHKDRRRVRLIISFDINQKEIASIMQFQDDRENLIYDFGNATGSLAEAVIGIFE